MTLIPGTVYDPDILLGKHFVPNMCWREPLGSFKRPSALVGSSCIFFCSYIELPRLKTLAICQQEDLKALVHTEIERIKQWLKKTQAHTVSVEYTYWYYDSFNSTFKIINIDFPRISLGDKIPETLKPMAKVFFRKYRPFKVDISTIEIGRRMGWKMEDLYRDN